MGISIRAICQYYQIIQPTFPPGESSLEKLIIDFLLIQIPRQLVE
jgi:hypothetical protein